jgi:hypothetical protein
MLRPLHFGGRNELSLQANRELLGKFPRPDFQPKGINAPRLEDFQLNPFDPRLRPHKIHRLSAHYGRTIFAVEIEGDLRAVFYVERDCVVTVDIGTHDLYRA